LDGFFNQLDLPAAIPFLQPLLSFYGSLDIRMLLEVH